MIDPDKIMMCVGVAGLAAVGSMFIVASLEVVVRWWKDLGKDDDNPWGAAGA